MTLLLTLFEADTWQLMPDTPAMLAACQRVLPLLGGSLTMHRIALVRAAFVSYLQASHAKCNGNAALVALKRAVQSFANSYAESQIAGPGMSADDERFEAAVLGDLVGEFTARLSDYHQAFTDVDTTSIGGNFEVLVTLKFAHLETEEEFARAIKEQGGDFIKSSVRVFYERLVETLKTQLEMDRQAEAERFGEAADGGSSAAAAVDAGPEQVLVELSDWLAEEGLMRVVEMADQFKAHGVPNAPEAALKELVKCVGKDVKRIVKTLSEIGPEVDSLLGAINSIVEAASELLGEESRALFKLQQTLVAPFEQLVEGELRMQQRKFDSMVEACIHNVDWRPLSEDQCVSGPTVDLFVLIGQTLPMVLGSGLLLNQKIEKLFIQNIDSSIMLYAMEGDGFQAPLPSMRPEGYGESKKKKAKAKMHKWGKEKAAELERTSTLQKTRTSRRGSIDMMMQSMTSAELPDFDAETDLERTLKDEEASARAAEEAAEKQVEELMALCVRMNSLHYACIQVEEFAASLEIALRLDVTPNGPDQRPFAGSLEVVDEQRKKSVERIGAHVAFNCLRSLLYEKLYLPTPAASPLAVRHPSLPLSSCPY